MVSRWSVLPWALGLPFLSPLFSRAEAQVALPPLPAPGSAPFLYPEVPALSVMPPLTLSSKPAPAPSVSPWIYSPPATSGSQERFNTLPLRSEIPAAAKPRRRWYGWQTLWFDVISWTTIVGAIETRSTATAVVGASIFAVGPACVHLGHGQEWKSLGSLSLRIGLPGGLAALGYAAFPCNEDWACIRGMVTGLTLGLLAAPFIDAVILAWEPVPAQGAASGKPLASSIHRPAGALAPWLKTGPGRDEFGLSFVGTF